RTAVGCARRGKTSSAGPVSPGSPCWSRPTRSACRSSTEPSDPQGGSQPMAQFNGYCVKCREKRDFEGEEVEMANGRRAAQGPCPVCGTKINRMLGAKK